jgi:hypothetical protein
MTHGIVVESDTVLAQSFSSLAHHQDAKGDVVLPI